MYYIGINEKNNNQLSYYCRSCGHIDDTLTSENVCVLDTQLRKGEQKFNHIINEYTKFDPTLPRVYNIKCPNASCKTNALTKSEAPPAEIIYIRYDDNNMKYLYMCVTCDTVWKTDDRH
jgi:DNA-directed RNA polymerase subunit M/transcription elongation factor TFIIS